MIDKEKVKEILDTACQYHSFQYRDQCKRECFENPSIVWPYCWVCHRNDALAARIAELEVKHG